MDRDIIDITSPAAFEADCEEIDSQMGGLEPDFRRPDYAEMTATNIGSVDNGMDGRDKYVIVTRLDDDLTPEQAQAWLLELVFNPGNGPGQPYCHTVLAIQAFDSPNQCICTVQYRYDV